MDYKVLTSTDWYHDTDPVYMLFPGKIYQQNLSSWAHWVSMTKGVIRQSYPGTVWWYFYNALHNPASEKIVTLSNQYRGAYQIWAYIKRYNRL